MRWLLVPLLALLLARCYRALRSGEVIKADLLASLLQRTLRQPIRTREAESLVAELESASIAARPSLAPQVRDKVNGMWELLYSNRATALPINLGDGSLQSGGLLSSLQLARIEKVYQNIRLADSPSSAGSSSSEVQHILKLKGSLLFSDAKVVLQHEAEVTSDANPAQIAIYLKEVRVTVAGAELPALPVLPYRVNKLLTAGLFDVTYVDADLRISRGWLGELRVFRRVPAEEECV